MCWEEVGREAMHVVHSLLDMMASTPVPAADVELDPAQTRHTTSKATNSAPYTRLITTSALALQSQLRNADVELGPHTAAACVQSEHRGSASWAYKAGCGGAADP